MTVREQNEKKKSERSEKKIKKIFQKIVQKVLTGYFIYDIICIVIKKRKNKIKKRGEK